MEWYYWLAIYWTLSGIFSVGWLALDEPDKDCFIRFAPIILLTGGIWVAMGIFLYAPTMTIRKYTLKLFKKEKDDGE